MLLEAPATLEALRGVLGDGEVSVLDFLDPPEDAEAGLDDEALAALADSKSPAELMDATRRAGTKCAWKLPNPMDVSIYRHVLVYFDGSQVTQPFAAFLRDGPAKEIPAEVAEEIKDSLRAILTIA